MTLLDRFRAQSRDKHADPAVRLAFVEELPLAEREAIAAIAREDEDARVRKAAVAKLMDPAALAAIARDDGDESVRAQASIMLRDIALESFEEVGEPESLQAVDAISDTKILAQVLVPLNRIVGGAVRDLNPAPHGPDPCVVSPSSSWNAWPATDWSRARSAANRHNRSAVPPAG